MTQAADYAQRIDGLPDGQAVTDALDLEAMRLVDHSQGSDRDDAGTRIGMVYRTVYECPDGSRFAVEQRFRIDDGSLTGITASVLE